MNKDELNEVIEGTLDSVATKLVIWWGLRIIGAVVFFIVWLTFFPLIPTLPGAHTSPATASNNYHAMLTPNTEDIYPKGHHIPGNESNELAESERFLHPTPKITWDDIAQEVDENGRPVKHHHR